MALEEQIPIFEMKANDRVRLLLNYGGEQRPFFWFSMGKDASIYGGVRKKKIVEALIISKTGPSSSLSVKYVEGEPMPSSDGTFSSKISVHASGITHTETKPGTRLTLPPLRGLQIPLLLCLVTFQHPQTFEPTRSIRNRDVVTGYPIAEEMPLWMRIFATPSGVMLPPEPNNPRVVHQKTMLFACQGLAADAPNLSLQIDLCHGARGPWPPYSSMIFSP